MLCAILCECFYRSLSLSVYLCLPVGVRVWRVCLRKTMREYLLNKFFTVYRHGSPEKGLFLRIFVGDGAITDYLVGADCLCAASNRATDYILCCILGI
jgi:hypothetical protein